MGGAIKRYFDENELNSFELEGTDYNLKFVILEKPENYIGESTGLRLISFESREHLTKSGDLPIWNHPDLTKRERELVEMLANGKRVVDFMNQHQIKKETAHFHWGNVKKKLKISDRSDLVKYHSDFLKNYN